MGLNFRKSLKIAPGVRMNFGKTGVGLSIGGPGLRYSIHSSGRRTTTVGLPGTGLSYSAITSTRNYKPPAYGSGFEFGTDDPNLIHVTFDANPKTVVPEKALSLTKTGKLSEKSLSKTAYFNIYQDYVCSCAMRIARDMFALLPIYHIFVHAYEDRLNAATGYMQKQAILSVKYDRAAINRLNFTNLDPSDALINFPHKMKFKKTSGFEDIGEVLR